ncbi:hypothetical protein K431DRAFT_42835 [Polychaeton citri CBS 116435]|uniref:Uncharacterized protein n=1 Tax=Polychaeton citri CBS 116435 TaxID=1314669 RepID=A0A9P4QD16_9PEZI|nr:hypothetical protein K431DRAFT_42835 [Polychaeton citri CBS 116435]
MAWREEPSGGSAHTVRILALVLVLVLVRVLCAVGCGLEVIAERARRFRRSIPSHCSPRSSSFRPSSQSRWAGMLQPSRFTWANSEAPSPSGTSPASCRCIAGTRMPRDPSASGPPTASLLCLYLCTVAVPRCALELHIAAAAPATHIRLSVCKRGERATAQETRPPLAWDEMGWDGIPPPASAAKQ